MKIFLFSFFFYSLFLVEDRHDIAHLLIEKKLGLYDPSESEEADLKTKKLREKELENKKNDYQEDLRFILFYLGISIPNDEYVPPDNKETEFTTIQQSLDELKSNSINSLETYTKLIIMSIYFKKLFTILVKISGVKEMTCVKLNKQENNLEEFINSLLGLEFKLTEYFVAQRPKININKEA